MNADLYYAARRPILAKALGDVEPDGWPVRALLVFAGADAVGSRPERVVALATAVELLWVARFADGDAAEGYDGGRFGLSALAFERLGQAAREDRARAVLWAEAIAAGAHAVRAEAGPEEIVGLAARLGARVAGGGDVEDQALARFGSAVGAGTNVDEALLAVSAFDASAEPLRGLARRMCVVAP
ncbi:MAG: hypothetical protein HYY84_11950 [Deltaproteobacteria bacterium]|nr:hypothetical protein [Deltaproteobacteria bacterium]